MTELLVENIFCGMSMIHYFSPYETVFDKYYDFY